MMMYEKTVWIALMFLVYGTIAGYSFGRYSVPSKGETFIARAEFDTLAEALVQGCAPTDDRVAMAIENYCTTKHPLTKGTKK